MTIVEPIPPSDYGMANWVDYANYWREADAEWLMQRSILRYLDSASRLTEWPSPKAGQVTYNETLDRLEVATKTAGVWATVQQYVYLKTITDSTTAVTVAHSAAAGRGITLEANRFLVGNPMTVLGGALISDLTGLTIKGAGKAAKFTTDATTLISDTPISAPALTASGAINAASGTIGALSATTIGLSGTLTGGVINGTSGLIGGITLAGNFAQAAAGYVSQGGYFYGSGSSAFMRQRDAAGGQQGTANIEVNANDIGLNARDTYVVGNMRIMGGRGMPWHNASGGHQAWISPTIVSGSDPGAANFPDGTIWIIP